MAEKKRAIKEVKRINNVAKFLRQKMQEDLDLLTYLDDWEKKVALLGMCIAVHKIHDIIKRAVLASTETDWTEVYMVLEAFAKNTAYDFVPMDEETIQALVRKINSIVD